MSDRTVTTVVTSAASWLVANEPGVEWAVHVSEGCLVITGRLPTNPTLVTDNNPWQDVDSTAELDDLVRQSAHAIMDELAKLPIN